MAKMRVYCDHGALTRELRALRREGRIELVMFPYDATGTRREYELGRPSAAHTEDLHVEIRRLKFPIEDFAGSEKHNDIERIIGSDNRRDVLQIDSAYKSKCACLFTSDKGDILSKRVELEELLGIRFFHHVEDWNAFEAFLGEWETPT